MRILTAPRLLAAAVVACGTLLASAARADNFVVNDPGWSADINPGDGVCADAVMNPKCTLNAAIMEGNVRPGSHTITFAPGVAQVLLAGTLQQLRAPFTIIGNVLPVRTIINGAGTFSCFDLTDSGDIPTGHDYDPNTGAGGADGSTISNLVIQNCNSHGISANGHGYTFTNNYIGTNATGTGAVLNKGAGISISASRVYNNQTNTLLQNLFNSFPAQPLDSSQISGFASQLATLYSNALLGPVVISNNVISGNQDSGIDVFSENLAGVWIRDNMIGTDFTGSVAVPNGAHGIIFDAPAFGNVVGPGNVISGNTQNGIQMVPGAVSLPNFIMGNRIGLSAALASADIGNAASGINVDTKPETAINGRVNPSGISLIIGPGNVISDNKGAPNSPDPDTLAGDGAGVIVTGTSAGVKIRGNTIGLGEFPPGTPVSSLAYGNAGDGIIITVSDVAIGGSGPSDGNIIAGNARHGITIKNSGVNGTQVLGNSIGVHPSLAGDLTLGNGFDGIHIKSASTSFIGGAGATDFNTIAANGRNGVKMRTGSFTSGWGHLLQRNRIYGNAVNGTGIGIDIDHPENLANDPTDSEIPANYANLDQSQPVICTGALGEPAACAGFAAPGDAGGTTSMDFTLITHGPGSIPATYRIEFFKINAASVNAATSMTYLGEQTVTADILGVLSCPGGRCTASVAAATAGSSVVMTATDVTAITDTLGASGWASTIKCIVFMNCFINNTSEFSNVVQPVVVPVNTTTTVTDVTPVTIVYGQPVTATASVTAASGPAPTGTVTIDAGASSCIATLGGAVLQTSSGSCQLLPAPPVAGSPYTVTATYTANASFNGSTGGSTSLTVAKADTATTLSSALPDPSQQGAAVVVTAGVVAVAPGAGTPTGTITVTDGVGTCTITLPATTCNLTIATSGTRMLVATYNGDANFNADASPAVSHTVNPAAADPTTTAVTLVAPATSVFGQTVAATATVTSATSATGSVTLNAGASSCIAALAAATATTSTGTCSLAPALPAAAVPYPVTAAYPGGVGFLPSSGGGATATVNKASTLTVISANTPNPSLVNTAVAVTAAVAAVAPGAGTPSGTIVVTSTPGGETCTITLPAASCNLTPTTAGAKTLTAVYSGDANFLTGTSAGVGQTVNNPGAVATTTAVTLVAPATSVFGQSVAVTVTVTSTGQADGSVTVNAGASSCTATLAPATATTSTAICNLAPPLAAAVAAYPVTASYAGSAGFQSSSGGGGSATVNKASTTTSITANTPNPSTVNSAITVTAGVAAVAPGAGTPTGTIVVTSTPGGETCTITLPAVSCNLTPTTTGAKTLTAVYGGSANFLTSTSAGVSQTVNPAAAVATTTAVTLVAPATSVFGQTVAVTVTVTSTGQADGSVTVNAGGSSCTATLAPATATTSTANCNLAPPLAVAVAPYPVTASYAGSAGFQASSGGGGSATVNKASTTTSISANTPNPSVVNSAITVTAGAAVLAPGAGTPSGTITVTATPGAANCTITLPATSCSLTPTSAGPNTLTATYSGDASFNGSASGGVTQTVTAVTSFSGATATPGVSGTVTLTGSATCSLLNPQFIAVNQVPPPGATFPFGLFQFQATGCGAGGTITIQIVYSQAIPSGAQYWKFGATPGDLNPHWYQLPGATLAGNTATFSITDGQIGDDDVTPDGTITDQGGPVTFAPVINVPGIPIPVLNDAMLMVLMLAAAASGWIALRRRRASH